MEYHVLQTHLDESVPEVRRRTTFLWWSHRETEALRLHRPAHRRLHVTGTCRLLSLSDITVLTVSTGSRGPRKASAPPAVRCSGGLRRSERDCCSSEFWTFVLRSKFPRRTSSSSCRGSPLRGGHKNRFCLMMRLESGVLTEGYGNKELDPFNLG